MSTGKLGAADLAANNDALIGTTDEAMIVNIRMVNRGAAPAKVRLAIGTGLAPSVGDYFEYDTTLYGGGILENSGLALSPGEKIWARSDTAGVSVRAHGIPAA